MNKPPLMKSGRYLMVAALSALLPLTAVQADMNSATPTYSGEDRRQFQDETPGAQGPVRSDSTLHEDSTPMQTQRDAYDPAMRGAEGSIRSDVEPQQGYVGDQRTMTACPANTSEKFAPNAYYGEGNPLYSADGMASLQGRGRWC